jgi:hypothetical protein
MGRSSRNAVADGIPPSLCRLKQFGDYLLELLDQVLVAESSVLVEPGRRVPDRDLALDHACTRRSEHFAQLGL